MTSSTFMVAGMTCEHCVGAVTSEVGRVPGVAEVAVDLHTGQVRVSGLEPVDPVAVRTALEQAGYDVVG